MCTVQKEIAPSREKWPFLRSKFNTELLDRYRYKQVRLEV